MIMFDVQTSSQDFLVKNFSLVKLTFPLFMIVQIANTLKIAIKISWAQPDVWPHEQLLYFLSGLSWKIREIKYKIPSQVRNPKKKPFRYRLNWINVFFCERMIYSMFNKSGDNQGIICNIQLLKFIIRGLLKNEIYQPLRIVLLYSNLYFTILVRPLFHYILASPIVHIN